MFNYSFIVSWTTNVLTQPRNVVQMSTLPPMILNAISKLDILLPFLPKKTVTMSLVDGILLNVTTEANASHYKQDVMGIETAGTDLMKKTVP